MLKNDYLLVKIGVDTAENEPFKVCCIDRVKSRSGTNFAGGHGAATLLTYLQDFQSDQTRWLVIEKRAKRFPGVDNKDSILSRKTGDETACLKSTTACKDFWSFGLNVRGCAAWEPCLNPKP